MSHAIKEFSRFASSYNVYNVIQKQVAKELIDRVTKRHYSTILDVGCGDGAVYNNIEAQGITFENFIALDASEEMLSLHPQSDKIKLLKDDFNKVLSCTSNKAHTLVLSSSALQWSKALDSTFAQLSRLGERGYFAIFTANTFKTLHEVAKVNSPIYTTKTIQKSILKYFDATFEVKTYHLTFEDTREMFRYIKKSGVSGGEKQLGYTQAKQLMQAYPLGYLEFEVLFVKGIALT